MPVLRLLRRILGLLITLVLLALCAVLGTLLICLPPSRDAVRIPGLAAPVDITFDGAGIPHILATTEQDGATALGFVHARDRLFQMELMRRAASGEVAELAGPRALPLDRIMRVLGLRARAEAELATLPPDTRAMLDAYARGVNAYIEAHGRWSAFQFAVLGRPAPWTPVDSLLWGKTMGLYLSSNWRTELARAALAGHLPHAVIDALWPPQPGTPGPSADRAVQGGPGFALLDRLIPRFPDPFTQPSTASNEWAVDGAHSVTGAPLLAGDPHLAYSEPGIWYLARIDTPQSTLAGATAPGVPGVVIGHNRHIAWTFTTAGADTQDVFVETVLPDGRYATPSGPAAFTTRTEVIAVRGQAPELLTVRESRHGPVVSDLAGNAAPAGSAYAVAMANLAADDDAATGLIALDRAGSVAEAGQAAPRITSPVQNLLVADALGIGQFTTGRIPIRRSGDGAWPEPGADGAHDWVGWASGPMLPSVVAPPSGHIVNTNERTAPPDFGVFMGRDWLGDWRAQRVRTLLGTGKHSVADFTAMQVDTTSAFAQQLLPVLTARPRRDDLAGRAAATLDGWDGHMGEDQPQPLVFNAWMARFAALLLERQNVPANTGAAPRMELLADALSPAGAHWCGGDCGKLLDQALREAMTPLAARLGEDPTKWRWGSLHVATFGDPVLPPLTRRIPQPGDASTIWAGGTSGGRMESVHGPSYRGVYDLANLDESRFIIAPGQSANPLSAHFSDLLQQWHDGRTVTLGPQTAGGETISLQP